MTTATGPLAGLRVLDTATLYAGPLIATLLADHGADVLKVEPPTGDAYRSWPAMWAIVGRGKRSLTLDLRAPRGVDVLHRLLPFFDVIIENLPSSVAKQRRLSVPELRETHPRIVVVSLSGFGPEGPYANRPANGTLGEAMGGLTCMTGSADGPPILPDVPVGDAIAAAFGAFGALAALLQRAQSGTGAHVDLTVFDPILHVLGPALTGHSTESSAPSRDSGAMGITLRGTFPTADGSWVAISASTPRHEQAANDIVLGDGPLRDRVGSWIAARPLRTVLDTFLELRVPITPVNDVTAVLTDPQVAARRSLRTIEPRPIPSPVPRIDGRVGADKLDLPALGDANLDILRQTLGLEDGDIDALRDLSIIS
jgi:crotonobetainyl-CoA:carnitine CoA-transferase CaiB-like acyl-CoA transferase